MDFAGFRIRDMLIHDDIDVIAIELKPENDHASISNAISQAINYKQFSTHTYIAAPKFDSHNFFEPRQVNQSNHLKINAYPESPGAC